MKCNDFVNKSLGESSIHGFPYFVKRELHWLEKIFWGLVIILAAYFSISICYNQWERFRDNPIVYAKELVWGKSNFPFVGITLCSNFTDVPSFKSVIEETWRVDKESNETLFKYYEGFLNVVNILNINTLDNLKPYENDTSLEKLEYLRMLLKMRSKIVPEKVLASAHDVRKPTPALTSPALTAPAVTSSSSSTSFDIDVREMIYAGAITEFGICRTTSLLTKYTNPFGDLSALKVSTRRYCDIMNECNTKIFPKVGDDTNLFIFLHNVEDILEPFNSKTILRQATLDGSLTIELLLNIYTAETEVRNLPVAYRKCRYKDENHLKYFDVYRPGLCRVECRINTAHRKCGCKPFFYVVAPHIPVCDVKGMLCLSKESWPQVAQCKCLELCEEARFVGAQTTLQKDDSTKFEKTIIVKLFLPRMAIKRRVVFSTDQLIMSFGGAIGLFLGASFISLYGLTFVLTEYIFSNCWKVCAQRDQMLSENGKEKDENKAVPTQVTMVKMY